MIQDAIYIASYPKYTQCPPEGKPEYAFIGRSNVGKSSLINMLCSRKNLARVSNTPGKTQMLNYYLIDKSWYIVDLPGYGYAKISKKKRHEWEQMIESYLIKRDFLQCAFILIDSTITPQKIDLDFIDWMGKMQVPFVIVFTKSDKRKEREVEANIELFKNKMLENWETMPQYFVTSSTKRKGNQEIFDFVTRLNKDYADYDV